jgi:Arc/MetJ-type ribon-helix-helix transcriptional regulator
MESTIAQEKTDFVSKAVASGRIQHTGEAVRRAMALWVARERRRGELRASIGAAEASLAGGEGRVLNEADTETLVQSVMAR